MSNSEELLQQIKDEVQLSAKHTRTYQREAIIVSTLIEAFKIRVEQWPERLTVEVLKCIDTSSWALSNHLSSLYSNLREDSVEENLELIEQIMEEDE